jgi:hypothetical protein
MLLDYSFGLGMPVLIMDLCEPQPLFYSNTVKCDSVDYIVQGARYQILGEYGCASGVY